MDMTQKNITEENKRLRLNTIQLQGCGPAPVNLVYQLY